jgi:ATP-binding cassette subfamily B protein
VLFRSDRYFQSRPISDMADRGHSIHLMRNLPGMGVRFVQTLFELQLTLAGMIVIAPACAGPALLLTLFALAAPAVAQPIVNERDLRVRNHAGALSGFYLDTLLGLVPVRTHRAQRAIRHQHEALLVEWARSSRRFVRASIGANAAQSVGTVGLASWLLVSHFLSIGEVTGANLLLIFWTLKLPALGSALSSLAQQYPAQRNVLLRLLEPLSAPEELPRDPATTRPGPATRPAATAAWRGRGIGVDISHGVVLAGGHPILRDVDLAVAPGEHVAIVGPSGAGKSSLIGVLLGWRRLAEGRIDVDGAELTTDRLAALRHEIAWIDPATQIWNKSLLVNLEYAASDADRPRAAGALDAAGLRPLLAKLPRGLQTALGEGGSLLSGGEGQRVRLGRAITQGGVRLALLDEPFRGVDRSRRSAMLAEARERWRDVTLLCVTHDVDETLDFDRVLVIEDGRIVEDGAPVDLAGRESRYRDLLDAERRVRADMWAGAHWRHARMRNGAVTWEAE